MIQDLPRGKSRVVAALIVGVLLVCTLSFEHSNPGAATKRYSYTTTSGLLLPALASRKHHAHPESTSAMMHEPHWTPHGRSTRLHEWLLILVLLCLAFGARAEVMYRCTAGDGSVAFQAQPCAQRQTQSTVEIAASPAFVASPVYSTTRDPQREVRHAAGEKSRGRVERDVQLTSYECRASDGRLFYRHTSCPRSLAPVVAGSGRASTKSSSGKSSVAVVSRVVPRSEACVAIHRAGSIGRAGHERDEDVSTYDKNLGRDPCR